MGHPCRVASSVVSTIEQGHHGDRSVVLFVFMFALVLTEVLSAADHPLTSIQNKQLSVSVSAHAGFYEIAVQGSQKAVLRARVAAEIDHHWVASSDYPKSETTQSRFSDALGSGQQLVRKYSGLAGQPALVCVLHLYDGQPFGDVEVRVQNSTTKTVSVEAIRSVDAIGSPRLDLGAEEGAERVLSDSFSEDRPPVHIYDLGKAPVWLGYNEFGKANSDVHFAVGSQLVYNRQSYQSFFLGALSSRLWLTVFHLAVSRSASGEIHTASYTVDSTGTTEIQKHELLRSAPPEDQIELSLPVSPGKELASERLLFAAGADYHAQLQSLRRRGEAFAPRACGKPGSHGLADLDNVLFRGHPRPRFNERAVACSAFEKARVPLDSRGRCVSVRIR